VNNPSNPFEHCSRAQRTQATRWLDVLAASTQGENFIALHNQRSNFTVEPHHVLVRRFQTGNPQKMQNPTDTKQHLTLVHQHIFLLCLMER
jgi:hypothetical protein